MKMFKSKRKQLKKVELELKFKPQVEKLFVYPASNYTNRDFATKERKAFIQSISPLRQDEKLEYVFWWLLALVFGTAMPHERKFNAS